ncbi:MAG: pesticin C-terminus-like muramidase [Bilophila sp.]
MPIHTAVIRAFLGKWETSQTQAYIPHRRKNFTGHNDLAACGDVIASSGVTIGTGLDLGQQSEAELGRMGVPSGLIARFCPYLGLRREEADFALERTPLTITEAEREALDEAVHADYIRRAANRFDRASELAFEAVPAEAQAVIVSLFYQLGDGAEKYPKTWALLCAGRLRDAAHELKTGFTKYANRRADEGRLLERIEGVRL